MKACVLGQQEEVTIKRNCSSSYRVSEEFSQWSDWTIRVTGRRKEQLDQVSRYFGMKPEQLLNALIDEGITSLFGLAEYDRLGPKAVGSRQTSIEADYWDKVRQ